MLGVVCVTAFEKETVAELAPGQSLQINGYDVRFDGLLPVTGPNYTENLANIVVSREGNESFAMTPTKRFYEARGMPTTEADIRTIGFSQLYLSLGDPGKDGKTVLRAWWKPQITLIWFGTIFMVLGGLISLSDRRLRVGVAKPSKSRFVTVAEGNHVSV